VESEHDPVQTGGVTSNPVAQPADEVLERFVGDGWTRSRIGIEERNELDRHGVGDVEISIELSIADPDEHLGAFRDTVPLEVGK
jgi:hypothetical protein